MQESEVRVNPDRIFHAYDVRGTYPLELNQAVAYKVIQAYLQINPGQRYVVGYDMRESSQALLQAVIKAVRDAGKQIDSIGMCATDRLYFALGEYNYDGGIMITASHNRNQWNGIKMVGKGVVPLDMQLVKEAYLKLPPLADHLTFNTYEPHAAPDYTNQYVEHVLKFVDTNSIPKLKIVIDAGNGLGGINAETVFARLPQIEVIKMHFQPHPDFPHHIANPMIPDNTVELQRAVREHHADLGIAFDGDADRCFLIDDQGEYVLGSHLLALISQIMFQKAPGSTVVHEYRNVYAIEHEVTEHKGKSAWSKAGHAFIKEVMREQHAIMGGECSGHFYFQQNFYADNGLVPALLVMEHIGKTGKKLSELLEFFCEEFPALVEQNITPSPDVTPEQIFNKLKSSFSNAKISEPDGLVIDYPGWRCNLRASQTELRMRLNVEAHGKEQLYRANVTLHEALNGMCTFDGDTPPLHEQFDALTHNIWFTWNPHHQLPIEELYGGDWRKNQPQTGYSSEYAKERYETILKENAPEIRQSFRLLSDYLSKEKTWFCTDCTEKENNKYNLMLQINPIAYFCMEFGLIDWIQIYSGGLGILAGDYLKQASDFGLPVIGIGIFYHEGFFHQDYSEDGHQVETYIHQDPTKYPLSLARDKDGEEIQISIEIVDHEVWVRAWRLKVGRVDLLLLDTNFDRNERWEDKMISGHLYGGDNDTRLRQEVLLGIGGSRILDVLGIEPSLYHMNEGHSGFLVLEQARKHIEFENMGFEQAIEKIKSKLIFTNHTLKQAGNDIFSYSEIQRFFGTYLDNLHTDLEHVFSLGKDQLYAGGGFSMTLLGMRNARMSSAVSKLHGKAAQKLWPEYSLLPITNGVHMPTWVSPRMHELYDEYVSEDWHNPEVVTDWERLKSIPADLLWKAHTENKHDLIELLNNELGLGLNPDALTIAWARRLASYKRPDLIMQDLEKLKQLVNNAEKPVQILLAGKAHPKDTIGKELLHKMWEAFQQPELKDKVVLIPGYNWQLARQMVSGVDIWLNTPYRFEEASGTSGMKAAANGVLQLTTLDGWTDEVDWAGIGWVIEEKDPVESLYRNLNSEILPAFFENRDEWIHRMRSTIHRVIWEYSSQRMLKDYVEQLYLPVLKAENR